MPSNSISAVRSGSSIAFTANGAGGGTLTEAQAKSLRDSLTAALAAPAFGPVPGTFTVTAPVSKRRGNNVLHGVTKIIMSGGRVYCYKADGSQPKYQLGQQHESFSKTWGGKTMSVKLAL